ncbi:hypothetical protein Xen7305DRAFT_00025810 [Xenococcus sp. PCC 7305]|uniref:COP23 domain-containing protein n=1 Tax=Xenococcus sp. PCC 7305 TaxID=102125 RepID=UPI0002AD0F80|nr:COP23 domain-containing protein [Xenococcus sp. PCC 7305]ELS02863.1 hypothetical protein Xen7305DRAFT_00025810 [Xenococcus sp. PCC 7305]
MNLKHISSLTILGVMATAVSPAMAESGASNEASFACINDNGVAVTVSQLDGNSKPIFHWHKDLLASLDANPTDLCQDAAVSLNEYMAEKYNAETASSSQTLSFRADQLRGLPTVCATNDPEIGCEAVLFTLSPTEKPVQTANSLLTAILSKDLQENKVDTDSNERGVQSISYSISILDLIFGSKHLK